MLAILCLSTGRTIVSRPNIRCSFSSLKKISFAEIVEGEGAEARDGDVVEINYVCRRSNGYFVHR